MTSLGTFFALINQGFLHDTGFYLDCNRSSTFRYEGTASQVELQFSSFADVYFARCNVKQNIIFVNMMESCIVDSY